MSNTMVSPKAYAIGQIMYFGREGDACTGGTISSILPPTWGTDASALALGRCQDWEDDIKDASVEALFGPAPGNFQRMENVRTSPTFDKKFTLNQITYAILEACYRPGSSQNLSASTNTFNPLSGVPRQGWLHCQRSDQNNALRFTLDLWGELSVTGGIKSDGKVIRPVCEFQVMWAALNQIALA